MGAVVDFLLGVFAPLTGGYGWWAVLRYLPGKVTPAPVLVMVSAAAGGTYSLLKDPPPHWYAIGSSIAIVIALAIWWWRRKRPDKALRAYGEKSLARIRELARKAREATHPRPVLRPQPQGF